MNQARSRAATAQILFLTLLVAAAAVRVALARGDLWLDEIWSLSLARHITHPWEVLTGIHHDNNHPLNTLALFVAVKAIGAHASSLVYRLLPLLTGIATVALLFWTERQTDDDDAGSRAWIAAILCASSFLAIVYSSEARGYAPAAFFGVLAFASLREWPVVGARRRAIFGIACLLGFLSHLTFLFVYAGCAVWTIGRFSAGGRRDWRGWLTLHRFPLIVLIGIYLVDVRFLDYGGGPPFRMSTILGRVVSLAVGGPDGGGGRQLVTMIAAIAVLLVGFSVLASRRHHETLFFATSLVLAPAAVLIVYHARFLDVRYFFVLMPFAWLLMARALAHVAAHGQLGRALATTAIAVSIAGNVIHLLPMLRNGRGHYSDAVATMARLTTGSDVVVASDNDFRVAIPLRYYGEALPSAKKVIYVESSEKRGASVEWYITHTFDSPDSAIPSEIADEQGRTRCLVSAFPYGGISGANWRLYRLKAATAGYGQGNSFGP
jgi:uncharacterized membrane protein